MTNLSPLWDIPKAFPLHTKIANLSIDKHIESANSNRIKGYSAEKQGKIFPKYVFRVIHEKALAFTVT
jgi:hypothetical protein